MKKILIGLFVVALSIYTTISTAVASDTEFTPKIVFLNSDAQNDAGWQPVISALTSLGIQNSSVQHACNPQGSSARIESRTLYVGRLQRGIVIADSNNELAVTAIRRIVTGKTSSRSQMYATLSEAKQSFGTTDVESLDVDKHGYVKLSADIWATMSGQENDSKPTWVLLTSNPKALNKDWQMMVYRTIGAVTIELLSDSSGRPDQTAKVIASRLGDAGNARQYQINHVAGNLNQ